MLEDGCRYGSMNHSVDNKANGSSSHQHRAAFQPGANHPSATSAPEADARLKLGGPHSELYRTQATYPTHFNPSTTSGQWSWSVVERSVAAAATASPDPPSVCRLGAADSHLYAGAAVFPSSPSQGPTKRSKLMASMG